MADRIQINFYVDNYLDSFDEETEAVKLAHEITTLLDRGGFWLTKWLAPPRKLLASIPLDRLGKPDLNLERDELPTEKTLVILPSKHPLSYGIIRAFHWKHLHMGTDMILSQFRQHFWIIRGREAVKRIGRQCNVCIKERVKTSHQRMTDLPK